MKVNVMRNELLVCMAGLTVGQCSAQASGQATFEWFGLGDGTSFVDSLNWTPNGLPGALDEAKFDNAGLQILTFTSSPTTTTASIENDNVQFTLTGQSFTMTELIVGERLTDVGVLTLAGGHLETTTLLATIGRLTPANGSLYLTNGATMTNQRDLIVGDAGVGYFQIDAGCIATSLITFIADEDTATGDAVVRGTWNIQNSALIGNAGDGTLTVESGGDVTVGIETKVGDELLSSGSLTIDGAGSTLTSVAATTIGNFGSGSLAVSNGGTLTTARLKIADDAPGNVLVDAGTIIDSVGTGVGNRAAGTLTLDNAGMVQSPLVTVVALGTLQGSGTMVGPVTSDGIVNPGNGAGKLTVTGDYTQTLGTMNIDIGGPAAGSGHDQLAVNGLVTLGGTLNVSLINGYNPANGQFVILQGGTVSGTFQTENLPAGYSVSYEPDRVVVSIGGTPCTADIDGNGTLNLDDIDAFVVAFLGGDTAADIDGNGVLNLDDIDAFVTTFIAGCP